MEFEYRVDGTAGGPVRTANIGVFRVRGGLIVESRDYHDHARLAAAVGRLDLA